MTTYRKDFNITEEDQRSLLLILKRDCPGAHFIECIELAYSVNTEEASDVVSVTISMTDVDFISFSSWLKRVQERPLATDVTSHHEMDCIERVSRSFHTASYQLNSWNNF
jgi:hypothetical protein